MRRNWTVSLVLLGGGLVGFAAFYFQSTTFVIGSYALGFMAFIAALVLAILGFKRGKQSRGAEPSEASL